MRPNCTLFMLKHVKMIRSLLPRKIDLIEDPLVQYDRKFPLNPSNQGRLRWSKGKLTRTHPLISVEYEQVWEEFFGKFFHKKNSMVFCLANSLTPVLPMLISISKLNSKSVFQVIWSFHSGLIVPCWSVILMFQNVSKKSRKRSDEWRTCQLRWVCNYIGCNSKQNFIESHLQNRWYW